MGNRVQLITRHESGVFVTGYSQEWEFVEYVHDATRMGLRKALVVQAKRSIFVR